MIALYHFKLFQKFPFLFHAVTKKSTDLPFTFSLALHTGEDTQQIVSNRKQLSQILGGNTPLHYVVANQTHSANIHLVTEAKNRGWESIKSAVENCDALITNISGIVLTILTADCVPILLYDKEKKVIAAVHAGWKGTKAKVLFKTVQQMKEVYGCDPSDIIAGIAPSIGACCYEVGIDVAKHFFDFPTSITKKGNKFMLDLPHLNKMQLLNAGLSEKNIEISHICTSCNVKEYFSYRKEKGCSGRFMSIIGLN